MHIYAASVALLWTTALRAVTPPRTPRLPEYERRVAAYPVANLAAPGYLKSEAVKTQEAANR